MDLAGRLSQNPGVPLAGRESISETEREGTARWPLGPEALPRVVLSPCLRDLRVPRALVRADLH